MGVAQVVTLSKETDFGDQTIKNVTEIQLKTIVSDDDTSISLGLGDDVGDNFIVDTDKLVVEGKVGGNVGIGTTSPESALHVETAASHCAVTIARNAKGTGEVGINLDGGTGGKIWYLVQQSDSDDLTLWDSNGDAARVTYKSGGNVGIGTTSPAAKLEVSDDSAGPVLAKFRGSNDERLTVYQPSNGDWRLYPFRDDDSSYKAITIGDAVAGGLTVLGAGNVGINDTSPSYQLDVNGTARVVGAVTLDSTLGCGAVTSTGVVTGTGFTIGSAEINETELEILNGATLSTTELNVLDGLNRGHIIVGNASNAPTSLAEGSEDEVLTIDSNGDAVWAAAAGGGGGLTLQAKSASFTAAVDYVYIITQGENVTATLPAASGNSGKTIKFKATVGSPTYSITLDGNSAETIDGELTYVMSTNYEAVEIVCDGSNWFVI